jgi:glutathione S-transferase
MRLYDNGLSGNCYKVRLMLAHLGADYERIDISVEKRDDRQSLLGGKNPAARIPVLELDDGRHLAESNAILWYLAEGTGYLPEDRFERAQVLQWMFFEQYDHEPNIAVARYIQHVLGAPPEYTEALAAKREAGRKALAAMERHLERNEYLAAGRYTIADIALYAYTHVAAEGGVTLDDFPAIQRWIGRVAAQPGHVTIDV